MKGKLNLFQRTMLRWRELHPYSAVHAVRIDAPLDEARLRYVIDTTLAELGLTGFTLDARRKRYEYRGGPGAFALTVTTPDDPQRELDAEIERQLNARYPEDGRYEPFRFFAVVGQGSFFLGLAYDHIVAGGDSIVVLLATLTGCYLDDAPSGFPHPALYPPSYAKLFSRNAASFVRGLAYLPRQIASCRRSIRPKLKDAQDGHNGFARHVVEGADYEALRSAARQWGVTLNDALLALMLHAIDGMNTQRRSARRRREIGVASIMNLRGEFGIAPQAAFGQFLGSMRVSHAVPEGVGIAQLARDVNAETTRIKRRKLYLQTLVAMPVNALIWRFQTPAQRSASYVKGYPVSAGVSTLNVDALWKSSRPGAPPPVYVRGVPTGPVAPVVVAVTTSGSHMQAGVSYRTTALSSHDVNKLWAGVIDGLRTIQ